ncbi:hypothetical protein X801_00149, partial [Opisthorchis viverrini]
RYALGPSNVLTVRRARSAGTPFLQLVFCSFPIHAFEMHTLTWLDRCPYPEVSQTYSSVSTVSHAGPLPFRSTIPLPKTLLGLYAILLEDLGCTAAELVFDTALRLQQLVKRTLIPSFPSFANTCVTSVLHLLDNLPSLSSSTIPPSASDTTNTTHTPSLTRSGRNCRLPVRFKD